MKHSQEVKNNSNILITEAEAAKVLRVSKRTLQDWRAKKKGPDYFQIGKQIRYKIESIEKWMSIRQISGSGK